MAKAASPKRWGGHTECPVACAEPDCFHYSLARMSASCGTHELTAGSGKVLVLKAFKWLHGKSINPPSKIRMPCTSLLSYITKPCLPGLCEG